jgi:hypothetical protein
LTLDEFADLLQQYPWKRRITEIHVHHTWRPNHADFFSRPPVQTIEGMYRYHTTQAGFSDIAQHITIDPEGDIWTGRSWNDPPASARGFNGNANAGPFMFEMIGDFDHERDRWDGRQRDAAIEVIALVQKLWSLPPEAFRFHHEMNPKSCPGSSLVKQNVLDLVRAAHERLVVPAGSRALGIPRERGTTDRILQLFSVNPASRAVTDDGELPESDMTLRDIAALNAPPGADSGAASRDADMRDLTPDDFKLLRAHVVNLRMGALSSGGVFTSSAEDVQAIFNEHLPAFMRSHPKLRLVFFAHGGLNDELQSLKNARNRIEFYRQNGCYPIFFVWETGVKETLFDILGDFIGIGPGRGILDTLTDFSDAALEAAFRKAGFSMWANMKLSAERAFLPRQGGSFFVEQLTNFWRANNANMEMHAIGHSAGSIFHAYFLSLLCGQTVNPPVQVKTLHFLAPAITIDLFNHTLQPLIGGRIEKMTEYTMHKDFELADSVGPYRKSLLYLVSRSFEDSSGMPILGLEESIRRDPDMMRFFGLFGAKRRAEILFSVLENGPRNSTISKKHGDFDNDRLTMASVMRRILDVADNQQIVEFAETVSRTVLDLKEAPKPAAAAVKPAKPVKTAPPAVPVVTVPSTGRRFALCVGIDDYPARYRLNGCVNDANDWSATLRNVGFDTQLMLDAEATWENIREALAALIGRTRSGDVVVVQYAGHGTRVNDLDGDEESGRDSALCPVNFPDGGFLIDDDVRGIFQRLPDGVNLTCFFDCCHSGTITRLVAPTPSKARGDVRIRGFHANPVLEEAHREFRSSLRQASGMRSAPAARGPASMREVSFSACTDAQTAQEIDGHGQFTLRALKILAGGLEGLTNGIFLDRVLTAFGPDAADQTPGLDCSPAVRDLPLLAPFASAAAHAAAGGR